MKFPKVLVISNNPFSKTQNNGKTLASFFEGFPPENIAQLYFSSETPTETKYNNYYRISDVDILKKFFSTQKAGQTIKTHNSSQAIVTVQKKRKRSELFRLMREVLWLSKKWRSKKLLEWINSFSPDLIFFLAGDSGFAYEIVFNIVSSTRKKLVVYITDDYILQRRNVSILWQLRRNLILKKMQRAIEISSLFITISEEMRITYKQIFKKDSIIAFNMVDSKEVELPVLCDIANNKIVIVYAGGLHFKRYECLGVLAEAIYRLNKSRKKKVFLKIYSNQKPTEEMTSILNIEGSSQIYSKIESDQLLVEYAKANILLHVESFDPRSIESTRLSISTKIPEYLAMGKPILAIGPEEIASMKFLSKVAFCINNPKNINSGLVSLLEDEKRLQEMSTQSTAFYNEKYSGDVLRMRFHSCLLNLVN